MREFQETGDMRDHPWWPRPSLRDKTGGGFWEASWQSEGWAVGLADGSRAFCFRELERTPWWQLWRFWRRTGRAVEGGGEVFKRFERI